MRILGINTFNNFSTGTMMVSLLKSAEDNGHSIKCLYGRCKNESYGDYIGTNFFLNNVSNAFVYFTGLIGHFHLYETKKILRKIREFKPDIIHFFNVHGNFCNFNKIMKFIYDNKIKLVMTAEDFWYGTGRCAHHLSCEGWKSGCGQCNDKRKYMHTFLFDKSKKLLDEKNRWYSLIKPIIVCPSKWLYNEFLISRTHEFVQLKLIYNGVDDAVFKYLNYKKEGKIRILGVASRWTDLKGLDTFNKLAESLNPDRFEITLIGLTDDVVTNKNIKRVKKTTNQDELVEYYNRADLFVNPTMVDTFPTTNIESILCGTPVFVYDVCGAGEAINEISGLKIKPNDFESLLAEIKKFERNKYNGFSIREYAKRFSKETYYSNYLELYNSVMKDL